MSATTEKPHQYEKTLLFEYHKSLRSVKTICILCCNDMLITGNTLHCTIPGYTFSMLIIKDSKLIRLSHGN